MVRLLFVCMGNICRSPTAEGVMANLLREQQLENAVTIDSAGTGAWHVGNPPDSRSTAAARVRGIILSGAARQVADQDFDDFDLLLCADESNARDLRRLAADDEQREKIRLLRSYDPDSVAAGELDVPDPYYGGPDGFENVLDLIDRACRGLLEELRAEGRL
jgi:protein-tyrosine phosphatase